MASAVLFFPLRMSTFTNFASILLLYFGSGSVSLFTMTVFLGICVFLKDSMKEVDDFASFVFRPPSLGFLFRCLRSVFGTALFAVCNPHGIERAPHDVVPDARKVLDPASADEHDGVLLQVVSYARNVRRDLHSVREPHPGYFSKGRVRLLRCRRIDPNADAPLLGAALERGALGLA